MFRHQNMKRGGQCSSVTYSCQQIFQFLHLLLCSFSSKSQGTTLTKLSLLALFLCRTEKNPKHYFFCDFYLSPRLGFIGENLEFACLSAFIYIQHIPISGSLHTCLYIDKLLFVYLYTIPKYMHTYLPICLYISLHCGNKLLWSLLHFMSFTSQDS